MIKIERGTLNYGARPIFDQINLNLNPDRKIGLVGPNGAGKSTLLKILAQQHSFDSGQVTVAGNLNLAYLPQEITLNSTRTALEESLTSLEGFTTWQESQTIQQALEQNPNDAQLLSKLAQVSAQVYEDNFDSQIAKAKQILTGLGFKAEQLDQSVNQLSVGWRMRIVLAKLLLQKANFYLFDEPTNHLDLVAKTWFLKFLKTANFGFLLVCHDKYFLEQLCDQIVEVAQGKAEAYSGNYSAYQTQKTAILQQLQAAYEQQQREISHKQAVADRFRYKASKAKMAQNILRQIERIPKIELPSQLRQVNIKLQPPPLAGKIVLNVKQVSHKFQKPIFKNVSFEIERGQKVALIAPNGTGKTTLFNLICRKIPLQNGQIILGHNVISAIFEQDQNVALDHRKTILQEIQDNCPKATEQEIRNLAGAFLFSNDDVYKPIQVLSGGEKNRVCMVKVLLSGANLLCLDEPTNHLDIPTKEILLQALQQYNGTILFVSHDHDFIDQLATHTVFLQTDSAHLYAGSYSDYLNQQEDPKHQLKTKQNQGPQKTTTQRREVQRLEQAITKLENQITQIELAFEGLLYGTPAFVEQTQKLKLARTKLTEQTRLWEALIAKN